MLFCIAAPTWLQTWGVQPSSQSSSLGRLSEAGAIFTLQPILR